MNTVRQTCIAGVAMAFVASGCFAPLSTGEEKKGRLSAGDALVLTGTVRDRETGDPIADAGITARSQSKQVYHTRSDVHGEYTVRGLPHEQLVIGVCAGGYVSIRSDIFQVRMSKGITNVCNVVLQPEDVVVVLVTDEQNRPIRGAEVDVWGGSFSHTHGEKTDAHGRARVNKVSRYEQLSLEVKREGYESSKHTCPRFAPDSPMCETRAVLKPSKTARTVKGVFKGHVYGPDGQPLPGVQVSWGYVYRLDECKTTTDRAGAYALVFETNEHDTYHLHQPTRALPTTQEVRGRRSEVSNQELSR